VKVSKDLQGRIQYSPVAEIIITGVEFLQILVEAPGVWLVAVERIDLLPGYARRGSPLPTRTGDRGVLEKGEIV
jgi:hypothetical protein